jgi:enoyl-[acyl-carrier protein] reductase/trans-2-enoyl-CoA reductase (NAD+)
MDRLFRERLYGKADPQPDGAGRIRVDDWEMAEDVQAAVDKLWNEVNTKNLHDLADIEGYHNSFLRLFGFGLDDVDYTADTNPATVVPSLEAGI